MFEIVASVLAVVCKNETNATIPNTILGQAVRRGNDITHNTLSNFIISLGQGDQCAMRDRGPKNIRRGVQTDAILLRYASADHGTKEMLAVFG